MSLSQAHQQWIDGATPVTEPRRVPVAADYPTLIDILMNHQALLSTISETLRSIEARLGASSESRSSVKIETGAKRELKPSVHVYAGDTDPAANAWLVAEAIRLHQMAQTYCDSEVAS